MSFALYLVGYLIFTAGVAWALTEAKIPGLYVAITSVILVGIGLMAAVSKTRTKDQS